MNRVKFVIGHLIHKNSKNRIDYNKTRKIKNKNIIIRKYHSQIYSDPNNNNNKSPEPDYDLHKIIIVWGLFYYIMKNNKNREN